MPRRRRLSEIERSTIAWDRRNGVSAASLATRYDVSLKTIYNVVNHADERQTANSSRSQVVGTRVLDCFTDLIKICLVDAGKGFLDERA